jgi:hypothetical protein
MKTITAITTTLLLATVTMGLGPRQAWATDAVPFKGNAEGAIVSATPNPGGVLVMVLADGYATQLGKFTREEVLVLNPITGSAVGTIVFTAANGDQLSGVVTAQFTSPTTLVATYTFTGGTGRFANATGEAQASLSTPDGVHFAVEFDGSINKN